MSLGVFGWVFFSMHTACFWSSARNWAHLQRLLQVGVLCVFIFLGGGVCCACPQSHSFPAPREQSPSEAGERGGTGTPEPCDGAGDPGRWSRVAPRAVHRVPLFPQKAAPCVALPRGRRAAVAGVSLCWDSVGTAGLGAQRVPWHLLTPRLSSLCVPSPARRGGGTHQAVPCQTEPCWALLCHDRLGWTGLCHAEPGHAVSRQAMPCWTMPCQTGLCRAMLDCTGQCCPRP